MECGKTDMGYFVIGWEWIFEAHLQHLFKFEEREFKLVEA